MHEFSGEQMVEHIHASRSNLEVHDRPLEAVSLLLTRRVHTVTAS